MRRMRRILAWPKGVGKARLLDYYRTMDSRPEFPLARKQHFLLVIGLLLLVCGAGLILTTTSVVPLRIAFSCTVAILVGMLINFVAVWKTKRSSWFFIGILLALSGVFFLCIAAAAPKVGLDRIWPFFMIIVGISIIPAGYMRTHRIRAIYFIPAACFIFLGSFFLLFSLRIVALSLRSFMFRLWPFFFILAGVIVLGLYIGNRIRFSRPDKKED
jgi:hypothetical protein